MSGKLQEAIRDFDKVLELSPIHPNLSDVYYNRGHTYLKLAVLDLEQYTRFAPDSPEREIVLKAIEQFKSRPIQK